MRLSIIIVNWNTRDLLRQCLASVGAYPPRCDFELLVVDNGSTDGSARMVREQFPHARLIENATNVGFARANNQAIGESAGAHVLLLNSDTIVQPDALSQLVAFMDAHPRAGIVGAALQNADGSPQWCFGRFPTMLSETMFAWGLNARWPFARWFGQPSLTADVAQPADWVLGAALLIRRATLQQVGLLDEDYFMYSEEIDWAYRVKKCGWQNFVVRAAPIIHLGQQSSQRVAAPMKAELFLSKIKYFRKHHGPGAAALLQMMFAASIWCKRWVYRALGRSAVSAVWAETWAYFVGHKQRPTFPFPPSALLSH